jgi:Universal stress protein family
MIRKILVGLDGSEFSVSAVDLGISCARHFGAELVGLGVIDEPTIVNGEPVPLGGAAFKHHRDETLLADARRRVEEFLEHFGDRCRESGVAWRVQQDGGKAIGATSARLLGRSLGSRRDARRRGTCRIHRGGAPSLGGCAPRRAHGDGRLRVTRDEGILARIGGETVLRDSPVPLFLYH